MLTRLACLGLLAALLGCGKPPPASPAEVDAEQPAPQTEPAEDAQIAATLAELTQTVRKFSVEQRRAPETLEEVVAAGYLSQIPQAPAGKRFAIDRNLRVYLTD